MANNIALSGSVRQNLIALQTTTDLMSRTQNRLATGLKVNSALDNPNSFFTASSLNSRASDLDNLLDDMGQSKQVLAAASNGIEAITTLVEAAKAKANQALQSSDTAQRAEYATEFDALINQMQDIAEDSGYNGKNLLGGAGNDLKVTFNEDSTNSLTISAVDYTDITSGSGDLTISVAANAWATDTDVDAALTEIATSLNSLRSQASTFGTNLTVVENRVDFTKRMVNTLEEGAGKLTLADTNEEGANLLTLQTRQQLSSTSLSFASQADQNVLRLF